MIVQFKEEFLEALKEYGTGIRITTAFVEGAYKKFESLWNGDTLTFTMKGEGEKGPVVVYYSDYNDNRIGEAFILGTYTAANCPERVEVYIKGEVEERGEGKGNYIDGILYTGKVSSTGVYLVTKSMENGNLVLNGVPVEDKEDEELIITTTTYFNIYLPVEVKANVLSTYTDETIKFLEDPYQIEGCNIFKCGDSEIPTRESYEKHYRRQVLSMNTTPTYIDARGEKVQSSILYKDYKSLTIQAIDTPYSDSIYYVGNSKSVTISGTCIYDLYRVENGSYTLVKENNVEGIDSATLQGISGSGYSISDKVISFDIATNVEKSSFRGYIKFKDELGDGSIKTIESNIITFITYLGWSVEYSSNLKEGETGNIVFLFDSQAGSKGLMSDSKLTLYSDVDVPVTSISVVGDVSDYFNFDVHKEESSEQYKYVVEISTKRATETNGLWFPVGPSGGSELIPCTLQIQGSSDKVTFYCVQRAKYPLKVVGSTALSGLGVKITADLNIAGQEISGGYSNWDYEIEGSDTIVDLHSGKKIGNTFNIISRKNPSAPVDKIKFFRVGPSGEVIKDSWKDVMYCYDDNSVVLDVTVGGKSLGDNPYSYNGKDLFVFKHGDLTPQYFDMPIDPGKIEENTYFEFKWMEGKLRITPKEVTSSSLEWYPKEKDKDTPPMYSVGSAEFYCVMGPDLSDTIEFLNSGGQGIKEIQYRDTERSKEVFPTSTVSSDFNYWRQIGLDSRVSVFFSHYVNGYGVPFDGSITLETQYQMLNSRDIEFEPFVIQRMAGRYQNAYDYFADWKNQLVSGYQESLPLSMIGKNPSDILEVLVYNPDGTFTEIKDDECLNLDYIGLYKLFIKSTSTYRISIKGVEEGKQYLYFFNTTTDKIREGVLSIDKGSFDVITGEESCFAFYGWEEDCFIPVDQILKTYIQVEDLMTGETINIRLKRTYPDNNLQKVTPTGSDIFLKSNESKFDVLFQSNVETDKGTPTFSNSLFSAKGTVSKNLITTDIWIRGYEGHTYNYTCLTEAPLRYPISAVDTIEIINPEKYNNSSLTYDVFRFPSDPDFTLDKRNLELSYFGGSTGKIGVTVREDAKYHVFYTLTEGEEIEIIGNDDSYSYSDSSIRIYKNKGENTWNIEELTGENYGDETTTENLQYGTLTFQSYVDKDNFITNRQYTQEQVDSLVPGVKREVSVVRLCMKNSVSSIIGSNTNIDRRGEERTYECNFTSDKPINTTKALGEQMHLSGLQYSNEEGLIVSFRSRLDRGGYNSTRGLSKNNIDNILAFSKEEIDSGFYVYEGDDKVSFNNLKQNKWERGIRISGNSTIAVSNYNGTIFLGDNTLSNSYLSYNTNSFTIYVCSVLLTDTLEEEPLPCTIELSGAGANFYTTASLNQSSNYYGYPLTINLPENNSYDNTYGPYTLKITDSYGNSVTKSYYKEPNNAFEVILVDEDGVQVTETAFSTSGISLPPNTLYILTDAPTNLSASFSLSGTISTTNIGSSRSASSKISVDTSNPSTFSFGGKEYTAYEVTSISNKIISYYAYGNFNAATGFGHITYTTNLQICMYCNGGYSYSDYFVGHNGYCEVSLSGPFVTYLSTGDSSCGVDFSTDETTTERDKYNTSGSYFMANVKPRSSNYYYVDNNMYVIYVERDPKKYDTTDRPFNTYGYYAGFKLNITRYEYVYSSGGSWLPSQKVVHTIGSSDALLILPSGTMTIKNDDGEEIQVPTYISATQTPDQLFPDDSAAKVGNGSATAGGNGYELGLLYRITPGSFYKNGDKNSCTKTFTLSTEGINDTLTFTVNFEIYL